MINFTVYSADCVGNSGNCLYPNKNVVTDKESFIAATKMDHVTAKYKGNYRSKDNFESSDCIPLDCDNDHSENTEDWLTPFDIALSIPGVVFAASYSRHHNLPKGDKSARPRFHVFFPIPKVTDGEEYAAMKRKIADASPYHLEFTFRKWWITEFSLLKEYLISLFCISIPLDNLSCNMAHGAVTLTFRHLLKACIEICEIILFQIIKNGLVTFIELHFIRVIAIKESCRV